MRTEPSRTFIGSVACVDLVGYSRRSVAQQMQVKQAFNRLLAQVLSRIPPDDRIVLDTGDGAAIAFLADPQTCMEACLELRDAMNAARAELGSPTVGPMRIGVNLGPMRLTLDVNGRPNIVGDGVVSAERIMPLAQPGEIVASRSFHEMVSHISEDLARHFDASRQGQDRTGQAREVFPVRSANAPMPVHTREGDPDAREMTQLQRTAPRAAAVPVATASAAPTAAVSPPGPVSTPGAGSSALAAFLGDGRKVRITAAALLLVIAAEGAWLATRRAPAATTIATAPSPAPTPAPLSKPDEPAAPPATAAAPIAAPVIDKPHPSPKPEPAPAKPQPAKAEPAIEPAKPPAPKPPEIPRPVPDKATPAPVEAKKAPEKSPPPVAVEAARKPSAKDIPAGKDANARRDGARPEDARPAPQTPAPAPAPAPVEPAPVEAKPAPGPSTAVVLLQRTPVTFPIAVAAKGISEGQIRARLTINAAGAVTDVRVTASEPPRVFDRDAIRTLQGWRFNAGTEGRTYDVELDFKR